MPSLRRAIVRRAWSWALAAAAGAAALPAYGGPPDTPRKEACIAANESGQELRATGKLAEARMRFSLCEASSCPAQLREDCATRLRDVDAVMPSVVFLAKDQSGNDLGKVSVRVDGVELRTPIDGRALQVDPGQHTFHFEGEGGAATETTFVIREGEKERRETVTLGASVTPLHEADSGAPLRTVGIVGASAGVAGLVVGTVLAFVAKSTYAGAEAHCTGAGSTMACGQAGHAGRQTAETQATAATAALIAGGVLAAAGVTLYFLAPKTHAAGLQLSARPGGGAFDVRLAW
jgi:hypothetical protein